MACHIEIAASVLQVFTAAVFSFAHGSNDVANSIGPFATVYGIYRDGGVSKDAAVPIWILVIGMFINGTCVCLARLLMYCPRGHVGKGLMRALPAVVHQQTL